MNILPSNYTLDEIIKYGRLPEQAVKALEQIQANLNGLEKENDEYRKENNQLSDQLYHCKEFIESTKIRCESATECKKLVADILTELENSYIEL